MSWLWKKKSTAGVLALLVLPLLLPSQEATAQRKAKVGKGRPAAAAPAPGALPREATEAPEAPAADAAAAAPGAPAELPPPAPDPAALPGSPEQPAAPAVPPAQPATVPEEVDVQPARTEAPVGTAGLTTPAEPAPGALGELQLVPLAGFGWYKTSADREETRAAFGYGLEVSWHDGPLAVGGALLHRSYDRGYRGTGPAPEGGGPQRLMLEEQELGGHLAVSYDLAPLLEITRFGLSAAPYGGVLARQLVNDLYPATLLGVVTGARAGIQLARSLRFGLAVDYTYNLGQYLFSPPESLEGAHLGMTRWRADLGIGFSRTVAMHLGYEGSFTALEHSDVLESMVQLSLAFGLAL